MKKWYCIFLLMLALLLSGCSNQPDAGTDIGANGECLQHVDEDKDAFCDRCEKTIFVYVDFYSINDLHGKLADGEGHPGVDEMTTYLEKARQREENMILISAGDMWQGSAESNMTHGLIIAEWMNELDFDAMTMGNHEYDWGEDAIIANDAIAEFPFLAINIYDRETNQLVDYCQPSVLVDLGEVQVGIIGAMGDCYSSIAPDKVEDVYFKVGDDLTKLVKAESDRLREEGADAICYVIHDGYGRSGETGTVTSSLLESYYDASLSNGYVDLVFESHTHQEYMFEDVYGVYHIQHKGDNYGGLSYAELKINTVTGRVSVNDSRLIQHSSYGNLEDAPIVESLLDKYDAQISDAYEVLGRNGRYRKGNEMRQLVADLYYKVGEERWGDKYDIALGGGFISVRSPYNLEPGEVTYSQLQSLFPFDNDLVLCSIKGRDLLSRFFENNHENYFISYGSYGENLRKNVDPNKTYYIVTDTYSSQYGPNKLTEVERYESGVYARDLLAEYIKNGGLN